MSADANVMTLPEWAAWMGWASAGMAHQARREGRVVMAPDGKRVLAAESKARYLETADPARAGVAARHAAARAVSAAPPPDDDPDQDDAITGYNYQDAKARREHWAAEREENTARKEAGELIELTEHVAAFANAGASIRAALELWAAVLPPQLAGRDEVAIRGIITDQVEQLLHQLTAQVNGLAVELREAAAA